MTEPQDLLFLSVKYGEPGFEPRYPGSLIIIVIYMWTQCTIYKNVHVYTMQER